MSKPKCEVCFETPPNIITEMCNHRICRECLYAWSSTYITSHNTQSNLISIPCHMSNCKHRISTEQLITNTNKYPFTLPERTALSTDLLNNYLNTTKTIIKCPSANCSYAGMPPDRICTEQLSCNLCSYTWKVPTPSLTAKLKNMGHREAIHTMNSYLSDIRKIVKTHSCPGCGAWVEKNGGCPHMTCTQCRSQYCWLCMNVYEKGVGGHRCSLDRVFNHILLYMFLIFTFCLQLLAHSRVLSLVIGYIYKYIYYYPAYLIYTISPLLFCIYNLLLFPLCDDILRTQYPVRKMRHTVFITILFLFGDLIFLYMWGQRVCVLMLKHSLVVGLTLCFCLCAYSTLMAKVKYYRSNRELFQTLVWSISFGIFDYLFIVYSY